MLVSSCLHRVSWHCFGRQNASGRATDKGIENVHPRLLSMTVLMVVLAAMWGMMHGYSPAPDSIEYQGQTIQLTKRYANFEEYENDPEKIAPQELEKVHQLVKGAQ